MPDLNLKGGGGERERDWDNQIIFNSSLFTQMIDRHDYLAKEVHVQQ